MPTPSLTPALPGSPAYTATASKGLVVDLSLDVPSTAPFAAYQLRYPSTAAGVEVKLFRGGLIPPLTLPLAVGSTTDNITFANRRVVTTVTPVGAELVLDCEIRALSMAAAGEVWSVRAIAAAAQTWQFFQNDNQPLDLTISRIFCDPVAAFTIAAPSLAGSTVKEKDTVTLTAAPAIGTAAAPTVIGAAPPIRYRWTMVGTVAVTEFPACTAGQNQVFLAPGVYGPRTITLALQVWYEGNCPDQVGFLNNMATTLPLTISPRPQHLALVLDRSGSMSGARWEHAKTAAQILANLFVAMRKGVDPADRMTEIVFEDAFCGWHAAPASPLIAPVLPMSDVAAADAAIATVAYGTPGSCTPIGDGLIKAMDDLAALGVANDPHFTTVVFTDGKENCGSVVVNPSAAPAGVAKFSVARQTGAARQAVNNRMSLYTIGLGETQSSVLDSLASQSAGAFWLIEHPNEVTAAMAQMVSMSQGAQALIPSGPDGGTTRQVLVDAKVSRLAIAVEWADIADTIELAFRQQGAAAFTPLAATVKQCPTHGFTAVDVAALFGGDETAVPATEWQIVHKHAAVAQPIMNANLLIFVDLFVRADIVFDREHYDTGDPIVITARLRAGGEPITNATVSVELARPGESLGTFLSTNGKRYRPGPAAGADPGSPKDQMLDQLLRPKFPEGLPILRPEKIFDDSSAELFDDGAHEDGAAGDGNFANRFVDTDKEGTYTWRFAVYGALADGTEFSRLLTISKWVGISIDPAASTISTSSQTAPDGTTRTAITVYPKDSRGEFLGPFRPEDVVFKSDGCPFEEGRPDQEDRSGVVYRTRDGGAMLSRYDGGYTRVVVCDKDPHGRVSIVVKGVRMKPVRLGRLRPAGGQVG